MDTKLTVALDLMGGDNAPDEMIEGAAQALSRSEKVRVILVGRREALDRAAELHPELSSRWEMQEASEVISTEETPVMAVRRKRDSSIVVGEKLVHDGKADAFVSAGSTGAVLAGGMFVVGRMKGVHRSPLGTLVPTKDGVCLLVDSGANVDVKPEHLLQFAQMGSIYMERAMGMKSPRVALANIGVEEEKGNALTKEANALLKECPDIRYTGYIESREIPRGGADVIVCDGFAGNLMLKMFEGVASVLLDVVKGSMMKNLKTKIGALLIKKDLKETLKTFDATEYGGAPMLGLNGLVVKTHGSAKRKEVANSILQCLVFKEQNIKEETEKRLSADRMPGEEQ